MGNAYNASNYNRLTELAFSEYHQLFTVKVLLDRNVTMTYRLNSLISNSE